MTIAPVWCILCVEERSALVRMARAVKNRKREGMTFDEIGEANKEINEALKEVDRLL